MAILKGHYLGETGVTHSDGKVDLWADQSGNGHDVEQLSALPRAGYTDTVNGWKALTFSGAEFLEALNTTALNMGNNDMSIVFAGVMDEVQSPTGRFVGKNTNASGNAAGYQMFWSSKAHIKYAGGSNRRGWSSSDLTANVGNLMVLASRFDRPGLASMYVDGVQDEDAADNFGTIAGPLDSSQKFSIGNVGGVGFFKGKILELKIFQGLINEVSESNLLIDKYSKPASNIEVQRRRGLIVLGGRARV